MDTAGNVVELEYQGKIITIVGTAHVSEDSVAEVQAIIREKSPETVCIELCEARYKALTSESAWQNLDVFKVIKEGKSLFLLGSLAVGSYQRRLGDQLGVKPGAELLAAAEAAKEVGAEIVLADRDINVTLKRTWRNVSFGKKLSLLSLVFGSVFSKGEGEEFTKEDIEKLKESSNLSKMMKEFSEAFPEVKKPLIDERDQFLMQKTKTAPGKTIVSVVGAAHVPGMQTYIDQEIDLDAINVIPDPSVAWKLVKWIIPALIFAAFFWGYHKHGQQSLEQMLRAWVLPNAVMAALLTLIGGAKIPTIIVAAIASPITSLNPLLPVGIPVGLTEAYFRKPTVSDCESINEDFQSLRGIYRNKVTRVLLVAVLSIVGSALGAWIGIGWITTLL